MTKGNHIECSLQSAVCQRINHDAVIFSPQYPSSHMAPEGHLSSVPRRGEVSLVAMALALFTPSESQFADWPRDSFWKQNGET